MMMHLNETTGAVWRHVMFFKSEKSSLISSIVLDLAATLFTSETQTLHKCPAMV